MPFNVFGSGNPTAPPTQDSVDRRKAIAQALLNIQAPQGQQAGRFYVAPSGFAQAISGLTNVFGQVQAGKAAKEQGVVDEDFTRKMADALLASGADPKAVESAKLLPIQERRALLGQITATKLAPKKPAELERADAGNALVIYDPVTGKEVSRIAKGVDPGSQLQSETTRRGQDITASTATRGQDTTAATARRGQDLTASTASAGQAVTARGQDIGAATAEANRGVTARGQDIAAATAARAAGNKPLTEYQSKAVSQLTRMQGAEQTLSRLEQQGFSPGYSDKLLAGVPGIGNAVSSPEYQQYKQAAGEFIAGILRLDSGAAVPEVEFERYFQNYFAQPGDSKEVIAQKSQARERAKEALRTGMGANAAQLVQRPDPTGQPPAAQLASNSGLPPAPARPQPPPAALEALKANPALRPEFEAKYGPPPAGL